MKTVGAVFVFRLLFMLALSSPLAGKSSRKRPSSLHHADRTDRIPLKELHKADVGSTGGENHRHETCGGQLTAPIGTISHLMYSNNERCNWTIRLSEGNVIKLNFTYFSIDRCNECSCDQLVLIDGLSSNPMAVLCGRQLPGLYTSKGSIVIVQFLSDDHRTSGGFQLDWQAVDTSSVARRQMEDNFGEIMSPGFPEGFDYDDGSHDEWVIENGPGRSLALEFEVFDIEFCRDCTCDKLEIFDGSHEFPIYTFCGQNNPRRLVMSGQRFRIKFSADSTVRGRGFDIYWYWDDEVELYDGYDYSNSICGGVLYANEPGSFISIQFPAPGYSASTQCTWILEAPTSLVQLEFFNIDLVDCPGLCSCDTIEVYDPASHDIEHLVTSICDDSEDGPIITSVGHTLKVVFTGDEFGTNAAFQARWAAVEDNTNPECGDTITSDAGNLSYPRSSDNYDDLENCMWTIRTSGQSYIELKKLDVEQCNPSCGCDSLEFVPLEGDDVISLCGESLPSPIHFVSSVTIRFRSDYMVTGAGFELSWSTLTATELPSTDPDVYMEPPSQMQDVTCGVPVISPRPNPFNGTPAIPYSWSWQVSISSGGSDSFHLCSGTIITSRWILTAAHCVYERLTTDLSVATRQYDLRNPIVDASRYRVDSVIVHPSFNPITLENDIALVKLTSYIEYGILETPVCLADIPIMEDFLCTYTGWELNNGASSFEDLMKELRLVTLNARQDCSDPRNSISVRDDLTVASVVSQEGDSLFIDIGAPLVCQHGGVWRQYGIMSEAVYCQSFSAAAFTSVNLFTEWIQENTQDDQLTAQTAEECFGVTIPVLLSKPSGNIFSPGYFLDKEYPNNAGCAWRIMVEEDQIIVLHFDTLEMERSETCTFDVVKIFDGRDMSTSSEAVFCNDLPDSDYVSTGNVLYVVFTSDGSFTARGFSITYTSHKVDHQPALPEQLYHCGISKVSPVFPRIVGGVEAVPNSWPWQVNLRRDNRHICGGILVASRWVITAAHCILNDKKEVNIQNSVVVLGDHDLGVEEGTEITIWIKRAIVHENPADNDISLLELIEPVDFNSVIQPACIPPDVALHDVLCITTGWGLIKVNGLSATALRQVRVPIIGHQWCNMSYPNQIEPSMICAGYPEGGKDSCSGDSGGPLVCNIAGTYYLYGVTSWGDYCALANRPGVYVNIPHFTDWLVQETQGEVSPTY